MTKNQKGVAKFAFLALCTTLLALYLTQANETALVSRGWTLSAPIATILISFWLIVSLGTVANKRYFNEGIIGGSAIDTPDGRLRIDKAILQNTLEQLILAGIVYHALETLLGADAQVYLATLVALFSIGRVCFLIGYKYGAGGRAFGFGLTAYPTVLAFFYCILKVLF